MKAGEQWIRRGVDLAQSLAEGERPFVVGLKAGTMSVELFAPRGVDAQTPHAQDELYLVRSGRSRFLRGEASVEVEAGDLLFVPAGLFHRFEDFSDDFSVWVVFWGPVGGET